MLREWSRLRHVGFDAVAPIQPLTEIDQPAALAAEGPAGGRCAPVKESLAGGASGSCFALFHSENARVQEEGHIHSGLRGPVNFRWLEKTH